MPEARPPVTRMVRLGLYSALAAIPFELPNRQTIPVEIPTLAGAIFLATALLQPRRCFGRIPLPVWWFVSYLFVFALAASLNFFNDAGEVLHLFLLILQGILVCWAASNLLDDDSVTSAALLTFAGACLLRAVLPMVGIGRTATLVWTGGERITAFGQNENNAAMILSAGLIALLGLGYGRVRPLIRPRLLVLPGCALIAYASIETGSRGGFIALLAGLAPFALSRGQSTWQRVRSGVLALGAVVALLAVAYQAPVMRNRLRETTESGRMAGRENVYPALAQMFIEKPLFGWGPVNNQYELSIREGYHLARRDTHNLLLETLSSSGLLGAVLFCIGIALCVRAAWLARAGPERILPLALTASLLMANMSGNWMASKLLWFVFAYAIASGRRGTAGGRPAVCAAGQGSERALV